MISIELVKGEVVMKVLIVGAGGYGRLYVQLMLENKDPDLVFEGVVEKYFNTCEMREQILAASIPVYATMEQFYAEHSADLVVIATPPYLHKEQSILALKNGSYVLCEKPVAPTVDEAKEMLLAEKTYEKFIAIGYQWSYSDAICSLKKDILSGKLGKAKAFKTLISWPRDKGYYARGGGWGGRISKDGITILDSIASNACAHYIHNMIFILGESMRVSATPASIVAEVYRANKIENFDTCTMKMQMLCGAELLFVASHAAESTIDPKFEYTFENAVVTYPQGDESKIVARFSDGSVVDYGDPFQDIMKKFHDVVSAIKSGKTPVCTVETAMIHTGIIRDIYEKFEIVNFPEGMVDDDDENRVCVKGLLEGLCEAYEKEVMLSETKLFKN